MHGEFRKNNREEVAACVLKLNKHNNSIHLNTCLHKQGYSSEKHNKYSNVTMLYASFSPQNDILLF